MLTEIRTVPDVEEFVKQLVKEGTNVHPDDDFHNYVNMNSDLPVYTPEEAEERNLLMGQCFEVCNHYHRDIYDVMQEIFLIETGLDKFIPLPSQLPE
jgi:hypothetical protein